MSEHVTIHRNGNWTVEFIHPIASDGKELMQITLRQPSLADISRWGKEGTSILAICGELSGTSEVVMAQLKNPDSKNVLLAVTNVMPPEVRGTINQNRPLFTPDPIRSPLVSEAGPDAAKPADDENNAQETFQTADADILMAGQPVSGPMTDPRIEKMAPPGVRLHDPKDPRYPIADNMAAAFSDDFSINYLPPTKTPTAKVA